MRYLPSICAVLALTSQAVAADLWTSPVCIIMFDDCYDSEYIKGFPIFEGNGQQGTMFVRTDAIGTEGFMTKDQLTEMKDAGWDISNHTTDHTDLTTLNEAQQRIKINDAYDWLVTNGFSATAHFFAYPGGTYNSTTIKVLREYHIFGRTVGGTAEAHFRIGENGLGAPMWVVKGRGVRAAIPPATVKANIDTAIAGNLLIMPYWHGIVDSDPGEYENTVADVQEVSDYLKTKEDAGDIQILTLTEYFAGLSNPVQLNGVQLNGLRIE